MANKKYISPDDLLYYHAGLKRIFAALATSLAGYGITDAYTKTEVDALLTDKADEETTLAGYGITDAYTKTETNNAISTALAGITEVSFEVVQALPVTGEAGTFYFVPNSGSGGNIYDEYVYTNNAWEKIGTTDVDLSGYLRITDMVEATTAEIDTILAS